MNRLQTTHPYKLLFHISSSTRGGEHMDAEEEGAPAWPAPEPAGKIYMYI
jgi:hypothetical protein